MPLKTNTAANLVTDISAEEIFEEPQVPVRKVDLRYIPVDLLVPNSWNINTMDDITFGRLQDEIAEVGLIVPIEVVPQDDGKFVIIGGEHRWRAACNLHIPEVPCAVLCDSKWADVDLQKMVTVRLNVLHGKVDPDKFVGLYNEMASKYGADAVQHLLAYTDSQKFQKMLGWVKKGLKKSLPKEMAAQIEDATKEVKSVAELSAIIQDLFNKHGETVQQSYMIFVYGKQQHIYVSMDAKLRKNIDKALDYCSVTKTNINEFMAPVVEEMLRKATIELEKRRIQDAVTGDSSVASEKAQW